MPYKDKVKRAEYDKLRPSKERVRKHRAKVTHQVVTHPVTHHDDIEVVMDEDNDGSVNEIRGFKYIEF